MRLVRKQLRRLRRLKALKQDLKPFVFAHLILKVVRHTYLATDYLTVRSASLSLKASNIDEEKQILHFYTPHNTTTLSERLPSHSPIWGMSHPLQPLFPQLALYLTLPINDH